MFKTGFILCLLFLFMLIILTYYLSPIVYERLHSVIVHYPVLNFKFLHRHEAKGGTGVLPVHLKDVAPRCPSRNFKMKACFCLKLRDNRTFDTKTAYRSQYISRYLFDTFSLSGA